MDNIDDPCSERRSRFETQYIVDTSKCWQHSLGRMQIDSFKCEYAFARTSSVDTFFATGKYRRLWICNMPAFQKKAGDTILISGYIYDTDGSERTPGAPCILTEIYTKAKTPYYLTQ